MCQPSMQSGTSSLSTILKRETQANSHQVQLAVDSNWLANKFWRARKRITCKCPERTYKSKLSLTSKECNVSQRLTLEILKDKKMMV